MSGWVTFLQAASVEMVAAWAAMRQAYALGEIADWLVGIDNAINALGRDR